MSAPTAPPSGEHATESDYATEVLARLDRAHQMGCSDPSDPTKQTTYGEAAKVIRDLLDTESVLRGEIRRSESALATFDDVVGQRDHALMVLESLHHYANALEQMGHNLRAALPIATSR